MTTINTSAKNKFNFYMCLASGGQRKETKEYLISKGYKSSAEMSTEDYEHVMSGYNSGLALNNNDSLLPIISLPEMPHLDQDNLKRNAKLGVQVKGFTSVVNFDAIPNALKANDRWFNWRYVARPKANGDVKWGKPPFKPNGYFARINDVNECCDFERVKLAYQRDLGNFAGISYLTYQSHTPSVWAIDVDNCIKFEWGVGLKATISQLALRVLSAFCGDTYIEVSPSGTGFRVFGLGNLPENVKKHLHVDCGVYYEEAFKTQGIEWYDSNDVKPLTVTGNKLPVSNAELGRCAYGLKWLAESYMYKAPEVVHDAPKASPRTNTTVSSEPQGYQDSQKKALSDSDVLRVAFGAKNGHDIQAAYNGSDGRNPSAGDFYLLGRLWFYCGSKQGGGEVQLERLFRESPRGHARANEWNRTSYRTTTLRKILSSTTQFFGER